MFKELEKNEQGTLLLDPPVSAIEDIEPIKEPSKTEPIKSIFDELEDVQSEDIKQSDILDADAGELIDEAKREESKKSKPLEESEMNKSKAKFNAGGAKAYVFTFDFLVSTMAALWSQNGNRQLYKMSKEDKKDYEEICEEFFGSMDFKVSPQWMFVCITCVIAVGVIFRAHKDRKALIETNRKKEFRRRQIIKKAADSQDKQIEIEFDDTPVIEIKRGQFKCDKQGFYC